MGVFFVQRYGVMMYFSQESVMALWVVYKKRYGVMMDPPPPPLTGLRRQNENSGDNLIVYFDPESPAVVP